MLIALALVGPAAATDCHPSYEGTCVPIASGVDCAGGSGNGPEYVRGPVAVIGPDEYRLDGDGDGIACER
jgi:Excalibur calcium-binding domain